MNIISSLFIERDEQLSKESKIRSTAYEREQYEFVQNADTERKFCKQWTNNYSQFTNQLGIEYEIFGNAL